MGSWGRRIAFWLIGLPLAIVAVLFAISNRTPVVFELWPLPFELEAPRFLPVLAAALIVLPVFALIAVGYFAMLLLLCALIEARSCERFRLLSLHLEESALKDFYRHFMVSEAGHYRMFIDLAEYYADPVKVRNRWQAFLQFEAEVMKGLSPRGDRMH